MSSKLFLVISHASLVVISLWCLVSIRDLRSVDKITTGSHVEGPHGQSGATDQQQHTKAVAVTTGYDTKQVQILHHGFNNGDAAFHDEILAMVKSPEIQFPCAQVWYLVTFLAGVASLASQMVAEEKRTDSAAYLYPMLYASWATSGIGLPCLAAEFFYSYGLPKFARPLLLATAPPILFYQAPKYFSLVEQYNDVMTVCSVQAVTLLAIFVGNGSLLIGCVLLAAAVFGFGIDRYPKGGAHCLLLGAANVLFINALQSTF
jgi:hypothetical protein